MCQCVYVFDPISWSVPVYPLFEMSVGVSVCWCFGHLITVFLCMRVSDCLDVIMSMGISVPVSTCVYVCMCLSV